MPSSTYQLFRRAMQEKTPVLCLYGGYKRVLSPAILGHTEGEEKVLAFQSGGSSSTGLPPGGEWRCLSLSKASEVQLGKSEWHWGPSHTQQQSCVKDVDYDVNPESPYSPRRRLRRDKRSR